MINPEKFKTFFAEYSKQLEIAVKAHPEQYFPIEQLPAVLERMQAAIKRNSFNKDGNAFKATCKVLGIPHTYKAIDAYLERVKDHA